MTLNAVANHFAEFKYSSLRRCRTAYRHQLSTIDTKAVLKPLPAPHQPVLSLAPFLPSCSTLLNCPAPRTFHVPLLQVLAVAGQRNERPLAQGRDASFHTRLTAGSWRTNASSSADELLQSLPDLVPSRAPERGSRWHPRAGAAQERGLSDKGEARRIRASSLLPLPASAR